MSTLDFKRIGNELYAHWRNSLKRMNITQFLFQELSEQLQ